ncbi:MAG: hypothetical protein HBSAPP03_10780 [Phycisphaerae bacterium]|nr:MAG: hypothetical protein HBSAPP03_10780 [Phycisphaerae bacterium]
MPEDFLHWLDVEDLGEALAVAYPSVDPMRVGFVELRRLVAALPNFREQAGHPVNERILEEIQRWWIEARRGGRVGDDD